MAGTNPAMWRRSDWLFPTHEDCGAHELCSGAD